MRHKLMTSTALTLAWLGCGSGGSDAVSPTTGTPAGSESLKAVIRELGF